MWNRDRVFGSLVNLVTLIFGIAIGFLLANWHGVVKVLAQSQNSQPWRYEDVPSAITIGQIGSELILTNTLAADHITEQGYDLLLMHENTLEFLRSKGIGTSAELQQVVEKSHPPVVYRIKKQPTPTPPAPTQKPGVKP